MEGVDLDDIEGQLYQQMDWNLDDRDFLTHDEVLFLKFFKISNSVYLFLQK